MSQFNESAPASRSNETLFRPFTLKGLKLPNRIVMAPMTRSKSPGGVPGPDVAAYYRRRAEGGVGLIITEGTLVEDAAAGFDSSVPRFYGDRSLEGWKRVVEAVHAAGGHIVPQLWHVGLVMKAGQALAAGVRPKGPSGLARPGQVVAEPMTRDEIQAVIGAFASAAASAKALGFDGVELHGAHGYLLDQFFWDGTNRRTDEYGGDLVSRARFATEVVREVRRHIGPDFPLILRYSQWKLQDYTAKLAKTPADLGRFLAPFVDAGVDAFHCSTRRFWEPEFPGSNLNLAGWTKKLTGKPTISVGSVTLDTDFTSSFKGAHAATAGLDALVERMEKDEFDLVAIGRSLIVNPDWPKIVRRGAIAELKPFSKEALDELR